MAEIMAAARCRLGEAGAAGLSLREVARDIGMVSSAVYRYVDSRDDLLTRLIIEDYDLLGAVAEDAAREPAASDLDRWIMTARAVRQWALDNPHDYLLLYGTPVPGYAAPESTVPAATRVTFALVRIIRDADLAGRLEPAIGPLPSPNTQLAADLGELLNVLNETDEGPAPVADAATVLAFLVAWTQLFGQISFELTNQTRDVITDHAAFFDAAVRRLGHQIGLR